MQNLWRELHKFQLGSGWGKGGIIHALRKPSNSITRKFHWDPQGKKNIGITKNTRRGELEMEVNDIWRTLKEVQELATGRKAWWEFVGG